MLALQLAFLLASTSTSFLSLATAQQSADNAAQMSANSPNVQKQTFSLLQRPPGGNVDGLVDAEHARQIAQTKLEMGEDYVPSQQHAALLKKRQDVSLDNGFDAYYATIQVGNQQFPYVRVDTASAFSFINITDPTIPGFTVLYQPGSTATNTNSKFSSAFGIGGAAGDVYTDTISVADENGGRLTATNAYVGAVTRQAGFSSTNGVLGIGPALQNQGIITNPDGTKNTDPVPTFIDSLLAQGQISSRTLGLGLTPATSIGNGPMGSQPGTGTLTIGGVNPADFIGQINYFPMNPNIRRFYGLYVDGSSVSTSVNGNEVTTSLSTESLFAITDSASTLIYLPNSVFDEYVALVGGTVDPNTNLLMIPKANIPLIGNMTLAIGGKDYILTPSAQLFPEAIGDLFTAQPTSVTGMYVSVFGQSFLLGGNNYILGVLFLERYYSVIDTEGQRIGFAETPFTFEKTNELASFRRAKRALRNGSKRTETWVNGKSRLSKLRERSPFRFRS